MAATHDAADREMARLLAEAYDDVTALLQRNRPALDAAIDALLEQTTMSGQQVGNIGMSASKTVACLQPSQQTSMPGQRGVNQCMKPDLCI